MSGKIEISRELGESLLAPLMCRADFSRRAKAQEELRALLAAPVVERQPVAEVVSKFGDPEAFGEREIVVLADLSKIPYDTKLYTSPPVSVAVVLPEYKVEDSDDNFPEGFNACIDKVKELNQ